MLTWLHHSISTLLPTRSTVTIFQILPTSIAISAAYLRQSWTVHMSPPCQLFTRQGLRRDKDDRRTDSFFHLMLIISEMKNPPTYILMENVQGFETSHTRNEFTEMLQRVGYSYQEFLLSPNQCRIPNSRLRYYLLAKKRPLEFALRLVNQPCSDVHVLVESSPQSAKTGLYNKNDVFYATVTVH